MTKSQRTRPTKGLMERARRVTLRAPNFDSGIIDEPSLLFGGQHAHIDPKSGLALYGPYTAKGQRAPHLRSAVIGIVGPPAIVADAEAWLRACQGVILNDGTQPFLYPHFPGLSATTPMQCDLIFGDLWRATIKDGKLLAAAGKPVFQDRIREVVKLYLDAIEILGGREPKPNVVLCCIPQSIVDTCTVQKAAERKMQKLQAKASRKASRNQLSLFTRDEDESSGHQNLRRGLKAEAMQSGIPTQLVWPATFRLAGSNATGRLRTQDDATRAWNFTTALYHKAGGLLWRLADLEPGVCFVGVSFFRELGDAGRMRTSMAQAFTAGGDGYVLRGETFEWEDGQRSPHLNRKLAASLLRDVIEVYKRQNRESLPSRIVVHKSSAYWEEELDGFHEACAVIPQKDFVAIGSRDLQFYRRGEYPPLRGTYVKFSDTDLLLYTNGYVPYLRTYPGARVPRPLEILEHHGDSPWDVVLKETLALTKMNWNTADFCGREPITLAFSRRVGQVLAEIPAEGKVLQDYRFYM